MTSQNQLALEGCRILEQGVALVSGLDDATYRAVDPQLTTSSVGAHVRHCLDHVHCLLRGIEQGRVDYDRRERDLHVELDRELAIERMREAIEALGAVPAQKLPDALVVHMDDPQGGEEHVWSRSSVERELQALISHTVHHFALISFLVRAGGRTTEEGFGVARSTLDYWRERDQPPPKVVHPAS